MKAKHVIKWNDKEYKIPFDLNLEIDKGKEITIKNRFTGTPAVVPWFAAAVYDLIKSMRHIVAGPPNTCGRAPPKKH